MFLTFPIHDQQMLSLAIKLGCIDIPPTNFPTHYSPDKDYGWNMYVFPYIIIYSELPMLFYMATSVMCFVFVSQWVLHMQDIFLLFISSPFSFFL